MTKPTTIIKVEVVVEHTPDVTPTFQRSIATTLAEHVEQAVAPVVMIVEQYTTTATVETRTGTKLEDR